VIRVVLDANVLVSAALARALAAPSLRAFDALLDERIEVVGCPVLLDEVASVLGRDRLRRYLSIDEARRFVADLAAVMSLVADPPPPGRAARVLPEMRVERLIAGLTVDELREVVSAAVDRHDDIERQVRLIAARAAGDLAQLRAEVDRGLRTRRFLGYRESAGWAGAARPIVAELAQAVDASRPRRWSSCCSARSVTS
jgi:predicted nucleic acid-binding protein